MRGPNYKVVISEHLWTVDGPGVFEPITSEYIASRTLLVAEAAFAAGQRAADAELVGACQAAFDYFNEYSSDQVESALAGLLRATIAKHGAKP